MANKKLIDVDELFKAKNPRLWSLLPGFVLRFIKWLVCQDIINDIVYKLRNLQGIEMFREYLRMRNISVTIKGLENLPKDRRLIIASNHPLGGADGVIISSEIGGLFPEMKFLVNDLLLFIPGVQSIFLPVDVVGKKNSREHFVKIDDAYKSDQQIFVFPAGLVSRKRNGIVRDLEWKKNFVSSAIKYNRDIVPIHFSGQNSRLFYFISNFRTRIGIKMNIEMLLLPKELMRHKNTSFTITIGKSITPEELNNGEKPQVWAERIKSFTYLLEN